MSMVLGFPVHEFLPLWRCLIVQIFNLQASTHQLMNTL